MNESIVKGMAEILELTECTPETVLLDTCAWDSLALVATMALLDEHGINADPELLQLCITVGDIAELQ